MTVTFAAPRRWDSGYAEELQVSARGERIMSNPDVYIGMDVHKTSITVAFADAGRDGEIRRYAA